MTKREAMAKARKKKLDHQPSDTGGRQLTERELQRWREGFAAAVSGKRIYHGTI